MILNIFLILGQLLFIPGLIEFLIFKHFSILRIITISIIFNYLIILLFFYLGQYNLFNYFLLILTESLIIIIFLINNKNNNKTYNIKFYFKKIDLIAIIIIIFLIYKFFKIYSPFFGKPFDEGDVLMSWNRWAYQWISAEYSQNGIRYLSSPISFLNNSWSYYSQFIPALWSTFYLFTENTDLTSIPNFFSFFLNSILFFVLISSYLKNKDYLTFLLIIIFYFFFYEKFTNIIYGGLVDTLAASFSFLSFYLANPNLWKNNSDKEVSSRLITASLIAICAANIKISALYYSIIFFPICLIIFYRENKNIHTHKYIILTIFGSLIWFFYQYYLYDINIIKTNNLNYLQKISNTDFAEKLNILRNLFGSYNNFLITISVIFFSFFFKQTLIVNTLLIFPYILIWYKYSAYDYRNLIIIIPFILFNAGWITHLILKRIKFSGTTLVDHEIIVKKKNIILLTIFITIIITMLSIDKTIEKKYLIKVEREKKNIKYIELNEFLLKNINNNKLYTDYIYLPFILNKEETEKYKKHICYFFQKESLDHCKKKPEKGDYFISIYNDTNLLETLRLNYKIFFFREINSIKIFKFL